MECGCNSSCGCFSAYGQKTWLVVFKYADDEETFQHQYNLSARITDVSEVERLYQELWPERVIISINEK